MTSRLHDVAGQDKLDNEPHSLQQLTDVDSWHLLTEKLFPGKELPPKLCELRMQIVKKCQGLPLTIVILAGILANVDQDGWKVSSGKFGFKQCLCYRSMHSCTRAELQTFTR